MSSQNSASGRSSPLVPMGDFERNSMNQSRMSDSSGGGYAHSEGASVVSGSTVLSQLRGGSRARVDLGVAPAHHRKIRIPRDDDAIVGDVLGDVDDPLLAPTSKLYIWGTRIVVEDVQKAFNTFVTTFCADDVDEDENAMLMSGGERVEIDLSNPYYMEKLRGINMCEVPILNLNLGHLRRFNEALYKEIIAYPADIIPYLDVTINDIFVQTYRKELPTPIEIRPYNVEVTKNMRDLNPEDIDQLITTNGMVTRISPLIPEMNQGFFQCSVCKQTQENIVDCGRIEEPVHCPNCSNPYAYQLVHNRSNFIDKQVIKLQEIPGDAPTGQTQHTVTLFVHGSLVENVHPGDRVCVTGIFRGTPIRVNPVQQTVKAVFRTSIDVIHFRKMDQNRLHEVNDGCYYTDEQVNKIMELSRKPDVIDRLVKSLAPNIFGHDEIKKGILCLLFGGCRKSDEDGNRVKLRSEINLLLCGDPGTAKSQLLQYVFKLVPRSQYTSGKGSSAVGLSASITHDPDSKGVVLQTGSLVLADNGVCCIDEFDKMNDSTRSILHEVMEQQTLSIAKAGIICQLNARTSIFAAANPIDSKWNKKKNIIQNVNLPHTLLSRFDLIFLVLDPEIEEYDKRLAKHLTNFYLEGDKEAEREQQLDMAFLRDYIAYAKENIKPQVGVKTADILIQKYLEMRYQGAQDSGNITAYPRQLESLIRLSEAFAKMRLSNSVEEADVENAYDLYKEALRQSATDPATGRVNVGMIAAGTTDGFKKQTEMVAESITTEIEHRKGTVPLQKLFKDIRTVNKMIDKESFDEAINLLIRQEMIAKNGDRIRYIAKKTQ
ncbi:MCM2/3/5 family domain-containing protein [Ditylenchus destructor]|uniref:DNA replication licensing factor MCM4 n=1 Tax=Ditylenchus destructor TaxID=166010 RepID=A0AAD4N0S7_9BILA|nr:MCM2/3/5 family domain-containing protein [Ditylenchus destructor]